MEKRGIYIYVQSVFSAGAYAGETLCTYKREDKTVLGGNLWKNTDEMDVLILGMGTGTYATQCKKYFGDMNMEGVEIDEKITDLSRKYFCCQIM